MLGFKRTEQTVDIDDVKALCYLGIHVPNTEEEWASNPTNTKDDRAGGFPKVHQPAGNLELPHILGEHSKSLQ